MSDFARLQELARDAGLAVSPPSNAVVPYVQPEGGATVGDPLTCTMGEWTLEPTAYAYSWQHAGDPTEIGTGDTYTTVAGDADTSVHCIVTATNSAGSAAAPPSNAVAVAAGAARAAPKKDEPAAAHHPDAHADARRDRR